MSSEPAIDTVERWCWDFVRTSALSHKLSPPPVPDHWEVEPPARHVSAPGRPPELRVVDRAEKQRGAGSPKARARVLHAFFHHEMQAAELMAWALLSFPEAPRELKKGLVKILLDEVRHMNLYDDHIRALGYVIGDFPVRDWFWSRVPRCPSLASFLAVMGLGLESANLDHSALWAERFRAAGDEEGARIQELVGAEEIAHVRFAVHWFPQLAGALEFDVWQRALPEPLSPLLMRGRPIVREARRRAGQSDRFLDELEAWQPRPPLGS